MATARYSDARDATRLALMLDQERLKAKAKPQVEALFEMPGYCDDALTPGVLVQAGLGRIRRAEATGATTIPCNGVVTRMQPNGQPYWAPVAMLWMALGGSSTAWPREVWLEKNGKATMAKPTTGLMQKVGTAFYYDAAKAQYLVLVMPGDVFGISLGG
jgi:hypothetical protein